MTPDELAMLDDDGPSSGDVPPVTQWPDHRRSGCRHTLSHRDPAGTWAEREENGRTVVDCRRCGKFYGYIRAEETPKPAQERAPARRPGKWWIGRKPAKEQTQLAL